MSQGSLKSAAPQGATPQTGSVTETSETAPLQVANAGQAADVAATRVAAVEIGGRGGPEPTRYGDWEKAGRCIDF